MTTTHTPGATVGLKLNDDQAQRLASWLREEREAREMTIIELATAAGVSHDTVGKIEREANGKDGPSFGSIKSIEDALGVTRGTMRAVAYDRPIPDATDVSELLAQLARQQTELLSALGDLESRVGRLERPPEQ